MLFRSVFEIASKYCISDSFVDHDGYSISSIKEISSGCSLEGLMLKLKLQYFDHLMRRVDLLEKTLIWEGLGAGGEGDDRE